MIDPRALMIAILKSVWPGGATTPNYGTMKGSPLHKPDRNIDLLADASTTASLAILAQVSSIGIPIDTIKITITGRGIEEIVARYIDE